MSSQATATSDLAGARPYRSHKVPACGRCRKRKLRCNVDIPGQPCHSCRLSSSVCGQDVVGSTRHQQVKRRQQRQISTLNNVAPEDRAQSYASPTFNRRKTFRNEESHDTSDPDSAHQNGGSKSSLIVGPVTAEDVQVIEKYMQTQNNLHNSPHDRMYQTISDDPQDPILYLTVPRRRQGLSLNNRPGEKQREILEQILGPWTDEVISLYFKYVHPAFPILDESQFLHLYRTGNKSLSAALVCDLLTAALVYWPLSPILAPHPCPDIRYAWNLSVEALQEEFAAPGISTIHAALLDLNGRPTTSITWNTINSGRTVGLSHILGLNRDPMRWRMGEKEKGMRVRLWWGVLIHDRWSSFTHGVPSFITRNQYEVPLPTTEMLITPGIATESRIASAQCFIGLCTLTEILGDILPLVYDRKQKTEAEMSKTLRHLETDLDRWEESDLITSIFAANGELPLVSGAGSIMLGFLSVKMLICRITFRNATHTPSLPETRKYSQALLRESAHNIIKFLCSLSSKHLGGFWSPYTAYHMVSATIILLRCIIESPDQDQAFASSCKTSLRDFLKWVRKAKSEGWDLVEVCIAQCEAPILMVCGSVDTNTSMARETENMSATGAANMDSGGMRVEEMGGFDTAMLGFLGWDGGVHTGPTVMDTQNNVNGFEYPWADLWDFS